ncbi:MAG: sulfite exporter TauE/SafE family protein [Infirmifilum sp.]
MSEAFNALAGFAAELVDGTLGMAFGVTASTLLQAAGLPPATSSATIHTAEVFLTAVNGLSHFKLGNFDKELFQKLVVPGVVAATIGAYVLSVLNTPWLTKLVQLYLLAIGALILLRALGIRAKLPANSMLLGALGGFLDAVGGGGWGPLVTGTLLATDREPRTAIGSVNAAEFFVTAAQAATFLAVLKGVYINHFLPFTVGGLLAAPLGALILKKVGTRKWIFALVALLLITVNAAKLLS